MYRKLNGMHQFKETILTFLSLPWSVQKHPLIVTLDKSVKREKRLLNAGLLGTQTTPRFAVHSAKIWVYTYVQHTLLSNLL